MAESFIITIDQGTTGSRVFIIDKKGQVLGSAYREFTQIFPQAGWVEHDADEIWNGVDSLLGEAIKSAGVDASNASGIGITNQRETTVIWDKATHKPIHNAIVWQCRRTSEYCEQLKKQNLETKFRSKTGLVLDAYFSGTKIHWLLENVDGARAKAENGELLFGTIDSWLLFKLTGGEEHATDYTNASRTLVFNIHDRAWDPELLEIIKIPEKMLPRVQDSASLFGKTKGLKNLPDGIPIYSMIGDQQSALYGQLCHEPGEVKNTYGTGCFLVMNLGEKNLNSSHGLISTLACDQDGKPVYALEGSIFIGGAVIQWLRDSLRFFDEARESENMAVSVEKEDEVCFVPAFAGLGAPYWEQNARGAVFGLTRDTTPAQITRAALKSIALQSYDVLQAMEKDSGLKISSLRVDGGATKNNYLMNYQSAVLGVPVERPKNIETTVLGATFLAGIASGLWENVAQLRELNALEQTFQPDMLSAEDRSLELKRWDKAIKAVLQQTK